MPPRKSNVSAVSTTNEDGTPTKEPKDGVNIEVNPLSPLRQGFPSQRVPVPKPHRPPLCPPNILPTPTSVSYVPYVMGPFGLVPYNVSVYGAPSHMTFPGSCFGSPGQVDLATGFAYTDANAPFPNGPPGLSHSPSQFPSHYSQPTHITSDLIHGPLRTSANKLNPRADLRPFALPQDLSLPKTMVQRLAKGVLPANTQIQKDAIMAMQKGATVFVNYLAQAYVRALLRERESERQFGQRFCPSHISIANPSSLREESNVLIDHFFCESQCECNSSNKQSSYHSPTCHLRRATRIRV